MNLFFNETYLADSGMIGWDVVMVMVNYLLEGINPLIG